MSKKGHAFWERGLAPNIEYIGRKQRAKIKKEKELARKNVKTKEKP